MPANSPAAFAFAVLCVALATAGRIALGSWIEGDVTPFETYYPAALLAALAGGAAAGALAVVLGGFLAWWALVPPYFSLATPLTLSTAISVVLYIATSGLIVWAAAGYRRVYLGLLEAQAKRQLLLGELQHRMRNTAVVLQAIVALSLPDSPERARTISGRIAAVLQTSDLFGASETNGADLRTLLQVALEPYGAARIAMNGDDVRLGPELARALALTFHELATNAAKYGALSAPQGRLAVSWTVAANGFDISWIEEGGPTVTPPAKRGFGTRFIERLLAGVGVKAETDFRPEGLVCRIFAPAPAAPTAGTEGAGRGNGAGAMPAD